MNELSKNIPYNSEAEGQLLGHIMRENSILDALHFLEEKHFYCDVHGRIFSACREKIRNGDIASPITLKSKFFDDPDLKNLGKEKYLMTCCAISQGGMFSALQLGKYLKDLAWRRDLIEKCEYSIKEINKDKEIVDIANDISNLCEVIIAGERRFEMRKGSEITQSIINSMNSNIKPYSTGIKRLDEAMDGGLYAGKFYGFSGKKKHGKSILGGTVSMNLAMNGIKHLFICAEMSSEEMQQRNLARMGGFYPSVFRNDGDYSRSDDFRNKFNKSMEWQQDNIIFINTPSLTFDKLKHIVKQAILKHGIKGFILDYWQLVGGKEPKKSTAEHLDDVAQWLADTAKKNSIFVITMAQINQEGNTRGSEGIRLACDQLYQIHRPDLSAPGMWLEMMDTRYTSWMHIGDKDNCKLQINGYGPYFEEFA